MPLVGASLMAWWHRGESISHCGRGLIKLALLVSHCCFATASSDEASIPKGGASLCLEAWNRHYWDKLSVTNYPTYSSTPRACKGDILHESSIGTLSYASNVYGTHPLIFVQFATDNRPDDGDIKAPDLYSYYNEGTNFSSTKNDSDYKVTTFVYESWINVVLEMQIALNRFLVDAHVTENSTLEDWPLFAEVPDGQSDTGCDFSGNDIFGINDEAHQEVCGLDIGPIFVIKLTPAEPVWGVRAFLQAADFVKRSLSIVAEKVLGRTRMRQDPMLSITLAGWSFGGTVINYVVSRYWVEAMEKCTITFRGVASVSNCSARFLNDSPYSLDTFVTVSSPLTQHPLPIDLLWQSIFRESTNNWHEVVAKGGKGWSLVTPLALQFSGGASDWLVDDPDFSRYAPLSNISLSFQPIDTLTLGASTLPYSHKASLANTKFVHAMLAPSMLMLKVIRKQFQTPTVASSQKSMAEVIFLASAFKAAAFDRKGHDHSWRSASVFLLPIKNVEAASLHDQCELMATYAATAQSDIDLLKACAQVPVEGQSITDLAFFYQKVLKAFSDRMLVSDQQLLVQSVDPAGQCTQGIAFDNLPFNATSYEETMTINTTTVILYPSVVSVIWLNILSSEEDARPAVFVVYRTLTKKKRDDPAVETFILLSFVSLIAGSHTTGSETIYSYVSSVTMPAMCVDYEVVYSREVETYIVVVPQTDTQLVVLSGVTTYRNSQDVIAILDSNGRLISYNTNSSPVSTVYRRLDEDGQETTYSSHSKNSSAVVIDYVSAMIRHADGTWVTERTVGTAKTKPRNPYDLVVPYSGGGSFKAVDEANSLDSITRLIDYWTQEESSLVQDVSSVKLLPLSSRYSGMNINELAGVTAWDSLVTFISSLRHSIVTKIVTVEMKFNGVFLPAELESWPFMQSNIISVARRLEADPLAANKTSQTWDLGSTSVIHSWGVRLGLYDQMFLRSNLGRIVAASNKVCFGSYLTQGATGSAECQHTFYPVASSRLEDSWEVLVIQRGIDTQNAIPVKLTSERRTRLNPAWKHWIRVYSVELMHYTLTLDVLHMSILFLQVSRIQKQMARSTTHDWYQAGYLFPRLTRTRGRLKDSLFRAPAALFDSILLPLAFSRSSIWITGLTRLSITFLLYCLFYTLLSVCDLIRSLTGSPQQRLVRLVCVYTIYLAVKLVTVMVTCVMLPFICGFRSIVQFSVAWMDDIVEDFLGRTRYLWGLAVFYSILLMIIGPLIYPLHVLVVWCYFIRTLDWSDDSVAQEVSTASLRERLSNSIIYQGPRLSTTLWEGRTWTPRENTTRQELDSSKRIDVSQPAASRNSSFCSSSVPEPQDPPWHTLVASAAAVTRGLSLSCISLKKAFDTPEAERTPEDSLARLYQLRCAVALGLLTQSFSLIWYNALSLVALLWHPHRKWWGWEVVLGSLTANEGPGGALFAWAVLYHGALCILAPSIKIIYLHRTLRCEKRSLYESQDDDWLVVKEVDRQLSFNSLVVCSSADSVKSNHVRQKGSTRRSAKPRGAVASKFWFYASLAFTAQTLILVFFASLWSTTIILLAHDLFCVEFLLVCLYIRSHLQGALDPGH
eukprot:Blabericola_migrator_1__3226@NODE_194_length_11541_cov_124_962524_g167_i0_p1_GENE_NODE_194_length_11541_cov_124_962524_g167_i0NODE_194_length_11541_cov_124_962524_g167_i0_p1_ORF_typecomplete_len1582_score190_27PGAP1/PF07819_13/0_002_NODE_194_length_11541_cov_124_962524_g167_i031127857